MKVLILSFVIVALALMVTSSPPYRRIRQAINNDLSDESPNSFWWNRPTRTTTTTTTTPPGPPSQQAFDRCMSRCLRTPQYNPLCVSLPNGTRKTYNNEGERTCAEACGEVATLLFRGSCFAIN